MPQGDTVSLYGAGAPPTGARGLRELPSLNSRAWQHWWEGFAAAVPESLHCRVLAPGAGPKAKAGRWPSTGVLVLLPPESPARHPLERLGRDRKDTRAAMPMKTLSALSEAVCQIIHPYSATPRQSLTSCASCVHAVATAQHAIYG
jgi:hypothetical protein